MSTSPSASLLPDVMKVMDHVEAHVPPVPRTVADVIRTTYQDQDLVVDEGALTRALKESAPDPVDESTRAPSGGGPELLNSEVAGWRARSFFVMAATVVLILMMGGYKLCTLPVSNAGLMMDLREELAGHDTDHVRHWLANNAEGKRVAAAGHVSIRDSEGRAEMMWAGVAPQMCHALVQSFYGEPSRYLSLEVDGQSRGVSCEGASHDLLIYPKL